MTWPDFGEIAKSVTAAADASLRVQEGILAELRKMNATLAALREHQERERDSGQ